MNNLSVNSSWPAWIQQCIAYDREEIQNAINNDHPPKEEPEWPVGVHFGD